MYLKNTFFFDIHPPLGKLMFAFAGYHGDLDPEFRFDGIGFGKKSLWQILFCSISVVILTFLCIFKNNFWSCDLVIGHTYYRGYQHARGLINHLFHFPFYCCISQCIQTKDVWMYVDLMKGVRRVQSVHLIVILIVSEILCAQFNLFIAAYPAEVPVGNLRFFPAFFSALTVPVIYQIMVELRVTRWTATLAACLFILGNAW